MQAECCKEPESEGLRGAAWPQDLLLSVFVLTSSDFDAHNLRLVCKEWRRLFDSSLGKARIELGNDESVNFLARLRGLTDLDLSTTSVTHSDRNKCCLEALLSAASRLPHLRSLNLGLQTLLRPPDGDQLPLPRRQRRPDPVLPTPDGSSGSSGGDASTVQGSGAHPVGEGTLGSGAEVRGSGHGAAAAAATAVTTAVVTAPCSRAPYLPAAALANLTGLRWLSIGEGARPGDPPVEVPYGALPQELPLQLLTLRSLEQLELYGIPLAPPRGHAHHLSRLSHLTRLHLACSPPSLVRSAPHLTSLTALRCLALHCTPLGASGGPPGPEPELELELEPDWAAPAGARAGAGAQDAAAGGGAVAAAAGAAAEAQVEVPAGAAAAAAAAGGDGGGGGDGGAVPPAAPLQPPGLRAGSSALQIVEMLSTNCVLFMGLQRLAEAGVALSELSYKGAFLTLPPPYLQRWTSLESLDLSYNTLVLDQGLLESQLTCLTRLTHLDLSYNRLERLPPQLCAALSDLRSLCLSRNLLAELPPAVALMSRLTRLDVAGNCLGALPGELTRLGRLRHLDASSNRLRVLPEGLSRLADLELLRVACNRLTSLPGLDGDADPHPPRGGGGAPRAAAFAATFAAASAPSSRPQPLGPTYSPSSAASCTSSSPSSGPTSSSSASSLYSSAASAPSSSTPSSGATPTPTTTTATAAAAAAASHAAPPPARTATPPGPSSDGSTLRVQGGRIGPEEAKPSAGGGGGGGGGDSGSSPGAAAAYSPAVSAAAVDSTEVAEAAAAEATAWSAAASGPEASPPLSDCGGRPAPPRPYSPPPRPYRSLTHLDFSSNRFELLPLGALARLSCLRVLGCGQNYYKACALSVEATDREGPPEEVKEAETAAAAATAVAAAAEENEELDDLDAACEAAGPRFAEWAPTHGSRLSPSMAAASSRLVELDIRTAAACMRGAEELLGAVGRLTALTGLNAQSNALTRLPDSWTRLTRLQRLDLALNRLTHLPPGLSALRRLRHLSAASNSLAALPAEVAAALSALTHLDLSLNLLAGLPEEMGAGMRRLRVLDVRYNGLSGLPDSLTRLVRLRKLDVSRNYGLKELPYGTAELPCLMHVVVGKALAQPPIHGDGAGGSDGSYNSGGGYSGGGGGGCSEVALLAARGVRVEVKL